MRARSRASSTSAVALRSAASASWARATTAAESLGGTYEA